MKVSIRFAVFSAVLLLSVMSVWTFSSLAATLPSCARSLDRLYYSAVFESPTTAEPMRVQVGRSQEETVALISSQDSCHASCKVVRLEKQGPRQPSALVMKCRSQRLAALTTPVALLWSESDRPSPEIRFGSWLTGYQQARLRIELDRYSRTNSK